VRFIICAVCCFAYQLGWAFDNSLVGRWTAGAGPDAASMEIKSDGSAVMDGTALTLQAEGGKMKLIYQQGIAVDATYTISGPTLAITLQGETEKWQRVGAAPGATVTAQPAPPASPAGPAAVGVWNEGQLTLTLRAAGDDFQGELVIGDQKYPTTASASGATVYGTFEANGEKFMYAAKVTGDKMEFQSDGQTYHLKRQGVATGPVASKNPLLNRAPAAITPAREQGTAPAAPARPDPASGNWLHRPDEGFDLLLPGDFHVVAEKGGAIILGSNVTPGLILLLPSAAGTAADMERAQQQGVQVPSISMAPTGTSRDASAEGASGKLIDVSGTMEQTQVQGLLGAYLRSGGTGGMAILAATTPDKWQTLQPFAEKAVQGVRFFQPQISDRLLKARQALAGHSLVTSFNNSTTSQNSSGYYTGTATNSFRAWHCCASGRCRYEGSRSTSFQGGGIIGASQSGGGPSDGNWELQLEGNDYRLTFHFDGGGTASWTISLDANQNVFVDGTRVKVTTDSICNQL
jgi:hypothetical protein